MRIQLLVALLVASAALAGCADEATVLDEVVDTTDDMPDAPKFGPHADLQTGRPDGFVPTLETPTPWSLGEWWSFKLTSQLDGAVMENKRVVAGTEGVNYLVGMPLDTFDDEVMVMHMPGFGLVNKKTLGFEAHDWMFDPLQFPLVEGNTWTTQFESPNQQLTMLVEETTETTARITISGTYGGEMIYDAELGGIKSLNLNGYADYEITDHGFDFEGDVRVPHSHDLIFFHARVAQMQGLSPGSPGLLTPNPSLPMETITIPDKYDRVSFGIIFQDIGAGFTGGAVGTGVYQIDVTAPNGEEYTAQKLPTDGSPFFVKTFFNDEPAGDWQVQFVSVGAGLALLEGIGYVTFDVVLPGGCVLLTSKIHDHGGDCGGHVHQLG